MLLNFKRIDFMHEMKNFPWQFGLTLSEKGKFFPTLPTRGKERRHISCATACDTLSVVLDNANRRLHFRYVPHFPAWPRENMFKRAFLLLSVREFSYLY